MPIEFRFDWPLLTLSNRCLKLFGQWRPCFLRYANILIAFCSPSDRDTVYQISSRSDHRLPWNSFFVFLAPPTGKSAHLFFFWPKIFVIYMCIKFGEDISSCSRAIIFFVNMALDFRTFWGPIAILSENVNFFSIIIDIHFPENISAVVWIWLGKKPRTSSQKYVSDITQVCEKTGPRRPQITGVFFDFPWPKDSKYVKILSLWQAVWELLALSRFFCCSAPYGPIGLRIW